MLKGLIPRAKPTPNGHMPFINPCFLVFILKIQKCDNV